RLHDAAPERGFRHPRLGGMDVEEDGATQAHRLQHIRQRIHRGPPRTVEHARRTRGHSRGAFRWLGCFHTPTTLGDLTRDPDMVNTALTGRCFCGEVQFEVTGQPAAMGYCHCESCRTWSAGPVNAFSLWNPENLKITRGAQSIAGYAKTPQSNRKWCSKCGGHLFTDHPHWKL